MTRSTPTIRFKARLLQPATAGKGGTWSFFVLPRNASAKLPTRSMTTVRGTLNAAPFRATLAPDGNGSHWLKVSRKLREAARADVGDIVSLQIAPTGSEPSPRVPADLRKALAAAPKAGALWPTLTSIARRDWILWITSAKTPETRARRVRNACQMLGTGKRRICCFDRSGIYSKDFCAPRASLS
jgi:hypothetical protein